MDWTRLIYTLNPGVKALRSILVFGLISLFLVYCSSLGTPVESESENSMLSSPALAANNAHSDSVGMRTLMYFLASDELKGRETGSEGIELAATFLEVKLKSYGIKPYFSSYRDTLENSKDLAYNIVGVLEGSDPDLRDEYVVIGAHYDHIGIVSLKDGDGIANGANDNASGTSTVLELARFFGQDKPPARSLIFAFFSAEERGLLGSVHLAKSLKEQRIELYTMLNFEMTGVPMKGKDHLVYLTGYDKSNLAEICNAYAGENLVGFLPTAKEYNLFQRSDNYSFYLEFRVPSHTFSSFDFKNYAYYHQPGDEVSEMDYHHMAEFVNRMIPVVHGIANAKDRQIISK